MKVVTAKSAGFCFGVKRAVETVYEEIEKGNNKIYTFGPIIHNESVVKDLQSRGVAVIDSVRELREIKEGTVIIRSHGVGENIYGIMRENGLNIVDATCPFVKKIHNIVKEKSSEGYNIIIIGNENHPEVEGIKGWAQSLINTCVEVIDTEEKAEKYIACPDAKVCIVSQTTFNYNKFNKLVEIIDKKGYDIIVVNTICNATNERQREAAKLAREADAMIVIGGRNSSNTQKLYEICKDECKNTYYIQSLEDLDLQRLRTCSYVGITAGASTPNNIIEEVQTNVRIKF
ncbi:MAG: 4-hydroxy-3-methylbut-2-enyl diphosphate reductase [Lachnospiraceae bacterium]